MTAPLSPLVAQLVGALRLLEREWKADGQTPLELQQLVRSLAPSGTERQVVAASAADAHRAQGVPMLPIALDYQTAAEALMVSERKVRQLAAAGVLPVIAIGRAKRIPRAALVAWVDQGAPS